MTNQTKEQTVSGSLAIISNVCTPYRAHLHRRVVKEIPELKLLSVFTHGQADFKWDQDDLESIHPVWLGKPESNALEAWQPKHWREEYRIGGNMIELMKRHDVRFVLMNGYNDMGRIRLLRWCKKKGVPLFLRSDSNIKGDRQRTPLHAWLKKVIVSWIVRRCTGIMPMGRYGQAYFEKYGADPARCFLVPYEPDYALFEDVEPSTLHSFRTEHALDADRRYLIFSGRLIKVKRVDLLIEAFSAIAGEQPDWDLLIAGDGAQRQEMEEMIPGQYASRVHWLGFLEVEQLRLAYRASDVLVLPSDFEPWALVVNEALAVGLPVVTSNVVGAAPELIDDGVNGRIFESGDKESLIQALRDVMTEQKLRSMKSAVPRVLNEWRKRADPVAGIREAAIFAGAIEE